MIIKDANVFTQENKFVKGNVAIENGRFLHVLEEADEDDEIVDAAGLIMIPG